MAIPRPYSVPLDNLDFDKPGWVSPSEWLSDQMSYAGMSDASLIKELNLLGYEGDSRANVANWRKGRTPIPPELFPKLFLVFGFSEQVAAARTCEILKEAYPDIADFIRDPVKEAGIRLRLKLEELAKSKNILRENVSSDKR